MLDLDSAAEQLGIKRATIYTWTRAAGIKSIMRSNKAHLTDEHMETLRSLQVHIRKGGTLAEFRGGGIEVVEPQAIETEEVIYAEAIDSGKISQLVKNAQKQAAGILIAQNMLAAQFIEDPDSLPEALKAAIAGSKPLPKSIDPTQYAKELMGLYKADTAIAV